MIPDLAAAILAGGRARRFGGRDKSRLLVEGRSIINRQVDVLQQLTPHIFVVAPDANRFSDLGVPVVGDLVRNAGAIGGIYTAIDAAPASRVLVVACDLPFLDAGLLSRLVERASGRDAAWARSPRGAEPLLACYARAARAAIKAEIDAGRLMASALSRVLAIAEVGETEIAEFGPPARLLANVNTPEDYDRIKREASQSQRARGRYNV